MSKHIEVSIVIAAWNAQDFILNAINSALAQKDVTVEVLVVDDASTDSTCSVVESVTDPRVKLFRSKINGGPGGARNIGFEAAQGTWIAVLDSDDTMNEDRLKKLLNSVSKNTDVIIDNFRELNRGVISQPFYSPSELPVGSFTLDFLIKTNLVFTETKSTGYVKPLFKRSFVKENNIKYWPEVRIGEDYYFLAKCLASGAKAEVFDQAGYIYTIRDDSISSEMKVSHVNNLLVFDNKFTQEVTLNPSAKTSQQIRHKNLIRAYHYLTIVDQIKERKILSATVNILKYPSSAYLLSLPLKKRLFNLLASEK